MLMVIIYIDEMSYKYGMQKVDQYLKQQGLDQGVDEKKRSTSISNDGWTDNVSNDTKEYNNCSINPLIRQQSEIGA